MVTTGTHARTREEGARRRTRILDEAQRIISLRGYNGFGIQELAESCGLTKPGLLHHFGSKEQLLMDLLRDRDARSEAAISRQFSAGSDTLPALETPRARFIRSMKAVVQRDIDQPELTRLHAVLRTEALNPTHPAHRYFIARADAKRAAVAEAVAPFSRQPGSTARQILAVMAGLTEQWFREDQNFDLVEEIAGALEALLPVASST